MKLTQAYRGSYPPVPDYLNENWKEFFATEDSRTPGEYLYEDVFKAGILFPLQRKGEMRRMMEIARATSPKVVYEIGCDKGGGLYHWCKCFPTIERVIASELRGIPYHKEFERAFPEIKFTWVEGNSYSLSAIDFIREALEGEKIDCLFIDGDKTNFHTDFYSYLPLIREGGVVFMHDVTEREPRASFERVRFETPRVRSSEVIVDTSDTDLELERESRGLPLENGHQSWLRHWRGKSCGVGVLYL